MKGEKPDFSRKGVKNKEWGKRIWVREYLRIGGNCKNAEGNGAGGLLGLWDGGGALWPTDTGVIIVVVWNVENLFL